MLCCGPLLFDYDKYASLASIYEFASIAVETFGAIGDADLNFMKDVVSCEVGATVLRLPAAESQLRHPTWQCCLNDRNGAVVRQSQRTISQ